MSNKQATSAAMSDNLRLLIAQTNSANTHDANIAALERLAAEAALKQCHMLCLPEASGLMNQDVTSARTMITEEHLDPYVAACQSFAAQHKIWIHNGSTPVLGPSGLPVNRTHLINERGEIIARYDKIHLFDIYLPDGKDRLESSRYSAGDQSVVAQTPWGPMGLSICYDLRFPNLYREYALTGARIVFIPSAFMRKTGEAHWEVLLRARAIENGCFVVAAAQTGEHDDGRRTYGRSMVVHPWGDLMLDLGETVQAKLIDLDLRDANKIRQQIPSLDHTREYTRLI